MSTFRGAIAVTLVTAGLISSPQLHAQIPVALGQSQKIPSLAPLLRQVTPSVVSIAVRRQMTDEERALTDDPMLQDPLAPPVSPGERNIYAAGSGVIIDGEQGFIATGAHVVDGADDIVVSLSDGRRLSATSVGLDTQTDIAVVRVPAKNLTRIRISDSDRVEVGDFVLAIGNPFSIGQTVTSGIVSAIRRRSFGPTAFEDFIQTDASINLGSSGGALINLRGELVGMNAAILDMGDLSAGNLGIGFAIPANTVKSIADQLVKYGSASHGNLGVVVSLPSGGMPTSNAAGPPGVTITQIEPNSSASRAGLRIGDIITALNASPMRDPADLYIKTALLREGEVVNLRVFRDGREIAMNATLFAHNEHSARGGAPK
jgi:S1-C subfamily serine protease